ncbi:IPT/TIG domain-containing protein [Nocardia sp. 004]|uniref:IPT/TIG domain-containing protein n=1 Tax=Nocardia sp. 004 TaxID=3385978 RepID=UPI0039A3094B
MPAITAIHPASGSPSGGNFVIITGSGFIGPTTVYFGGTATTFIQDSPVQITAVSPPGAGTMLITVHNSGGVSNGVPYTYGSGGSRAPAIFGPGTSIMSDGGPPFGSWGTVAAVGYDALGNPVALTAGHLMTRNTGTQEVFLTGNPGLGPIGYYATWTTNWPGFPSTQFPFDSSKDYAVIKLDTAKITPVNRMPNGAVINRIGVNPVPFRDILCKYGQVSGTTYGLVIEYKNNVIRSWTPLIPGDSGGPATTPSGFVGISSAINPLIPWAPFQFSGIHGILADIAAQGPNTIGIGFTPLP